MQGPLEEDFNQISERSSHKDLHEITQGHLKDFASRASRKDLYEIMLRPLAAFHKDLRGFYQDLYKILSKQVVKDLDQDLHSRTPTRISQDRHKRTCRCRRGSYKILMQEPSKSLPEELSYKHL